MYFNSLTLDPYFYYIYCIFLIIHSTFNSQLMQVESTCNRRIKIDVSNDLHAIKAKYFVTVVVSKLYITNLIH